MRRVRNRNFVGRYQKSNCMSCNEAFSKLIGNQNRTHFAKKHGITQRTVCNYLSGKNIPIVKLEQIAKTEGYKIINKIKLEKL